MEPAGSDDRRSPQPAGAPAAAEPPCPDPVTQPEAAAAWLEDKLRQRFVEDRAEPLPQRLLALLRGRPPQQEPQG